MIAGLRVFAKYRQIFLICKATFMLAISYLNRNAKLHESFYSVRGRVIGTPQHSSSFSMSIVGVCPKWGNSFFRITVLVSIAAASVKFLPWSAVSASMVSMESSADS